MPPVPANRSGRVRLEAETSGNKTLWRGELLTGQDVDTPEHPSGEQWRCARCADLIGAYEPIVTVQNGQARQTSRTAELRTGRRLPSEHYHEACYLLEHRQLDAR